MSLINFTKSQGLGNDFIVIEDLDGRLDIPGQSVKALCDRHFGIGADGLILVNRSESADYFMNYLNADGSVAEMCGNGIRVFAKYIYDRIRPEPAFRIETRAGVKEVELKIADGRVEAVAVNMGAPILTPTEIPLDSERERFIDGPLRVGNNQYRATVVSIGNPHCIVFVDCVEEAPVRTDGPRIEEMALFPAKVNIEFVERVSSERLKIRVWERGVGETLACGTGACAAVVAANLNGLTGRSVTVALPGGELHVEWLPDNTVKMTGPAAEVFTGQLNTDKWGIQGEVD